LLGFEDWVITASYTLLGSFFDTTRIFGPFALAIAHSSVLPRLSFLEKHFSGRWIGERMPQVVVVLSFKAIDHG
jgi:hypothetical protein